MVKTCCAYNCKYEFRKGDGLKMHSFPRDSSLRNQWIAAMNRENFVPTHTHVLCSKHFLPEDYIYSRKQNLMLKKSAVPSLFPAPKPQKPEELRVDPLDVEMLLLAAQSDSENSGYNDLTTLDGDNSHNSQKQNGPPDFITIEVIDGNECGPFRRMVKCVDVGTCTENTDFYQLQSDEEYSFEEESKEECTDYRLHEEAGTNDDVVNVIGEHTDVKYETNFNYQVMRNRKQPHFVGDFIFEDLFDDVQRRKYWAMSHKVIDEQRKKLRLYATKIRQLNKKVQDMTETIEDMKTNGKIATKLLYTAAGCQTVQIRTYL